VEAGRPHADPTRPSSLPLQPNLDAGMRAKLESRLAATLVTATSRAAAERERRLATKYHRVRFFERVKADRALKKAQASLAVAEAAGDEESIENARASIASASDDLVYVRHFPPGERYVSLFRPTDAPEETARLDAERARLRRAARARAARTALVADADEGGAGAVAAMDAGSSTDEEDDFLLEEGAEGEKGRAAASGSDGGRASPAPLASMSSSGGSESDDGAPAAPAGPARCAPASAAPTPAPLRPPRRPAAPKQRPAAPPARPTGAPLRPRAEGGRKRRRKK